MTTTANIAFEGKTYTLQCWGENEIICSILMKGAFHEIVLLNLIRDLKVTGSYIDIGANIGNHALFFAAECPCDFVIAIEVYRPVYELCVKNLANNLPAEKFFTHCLAIANNEAGKLNLWTPTAVNMGRARKAIKGMDPESVGMAEEIIEVKSVKLDDLMVQYPGKKIGLIKLDIEGMEVEAIESGLETIKTHKPVIVAECSMGRNVSPNQEMADISRVLDPLGYRMVNGPIGSHVGPSYIWTA